MKQSREVGFIKAKHKALLVMEELTGISFRCWRNSDGTFQVDGYVGNTPIVIVEDECLGFGGISGADQETVERTMVEIISGGVIVMKNLQDDPDAWQIPHFSNIRELKMKAKVAGKDPFRAR